MNYDPMPMIKTQSPEDAGNQSKTGAFGEERNANRDEDKKSGHKFESISFYVFLATVILAPISFWANPYIPLDLVKTFIIAVGVIASAILIGFVAIKEKKLSLPPRTLWITGVLLLVSVLISSFLSIHPGKSLFGQGFELGNASFIALLLLSGLVAYTVINRQKDRAIVLYVGIVGTYIVLFILHLVRIIFGQGTMTLGILNNSTSSILGGWFNLGYFSGFILIISLLALVLLKLSSRMKIVYWLMLIISFAGTVFVADQRLWRVMVLVFLGLSVCLFIERWNMIKKTVSGKVSLFMKSIVWLPVLAVIVSLLLLWRGPAVVGPAISKANIGHAELVLPWQMTLNVTASAIQNYPLFGVGPNNFSQAYLTYKPIQINSTNAWSTEFSYGFGLVPTFVATHGVVGTVILILIFVFFGIISVKVLRNLPNEPEKRYMIISSFTASVFLWLIAFTTVPSHTILFYTFIVTGMFIGLASASGLVRASLCSPAPGSKMSKIFPSLMALVVLLLFVWGLIYVRKTIAFVYFGNGVKALNVSNDAEQAFKSFAMAIKMNQSDVYWRAKAETAIVAAEKVASTITPASSASTTQAALTEINNILNTGLADAQKAIAFDPRNYYNYISEARVSEAAANVKMQNGYENAVKAYRSAIGLNPYNPSSYLSLANLQAKSGNYDDAIVSLGGALQVKNNYLDAVFLLSQIYAAKGDIANATIAAKVAVQLNPTNPILLFQLGLLNYSNRDFAGAATAFEEAVKNQNDYANAKYFLGLSEARLNNMAKAIAVFEDLASTNPENQEVALILANLRSGKSIFTDANISGASAPEKRSALPIKEEN